MVMYLFLFYVNLDETAFLAIDLCNKQSFVKEGIGFEFIFFVLWNVITKGEGGGGTNVNVFNRC